MSAGSDTHRQRTSLRIAVYGKGGIGKSTIAANLSAAFAGLGKSVLQIGCDPKHDSTALLLGGRIPQTVLEHLQNTSNQADLMRHRRKLMSPENRVADVVRSGSGVPDDLRRQDVLQEGFGGVLCIEAGGPRPGVGCAGRGILTTFELLQKLNVALDEFDVVLYDVLGDVVCGGFGVPLRHEQANTILLVTSEEYMPLFAANNILRGVRSYDRDMKARLAGLVLNRRDNSTSIDALQRFSESSGLPILAQMPRSPLLQKADVAGMTLAQLAPQSAEAEIVRELAQRLLCAPLHAAKPVSDEELERIVLGRTVPAISLKTTVPAVKPKARACSGETLRLAVYGKGGIGKSTIAANLSATFAARGLRVLQIGCDPKHDSTRLLCGGASIPTVLEYLRNVAEVNHKLTDLVYPSRCGVDCVEVGGPEPGVGCAGRGILSAFMLLEKLGLQESDYDVILYDVLGDVVCGGFAIPLRKGYAQSVLLVSSEEFMPLYAANNLLRGINGISGVECKLLGLFHNVRDNDADFSAIERFSQATGLPVAARMPRSPVVQAAEQRSLPLAVHAPQSQETQVIASLCEQILNRPALHPPAPLSEPAFHALLRGQPLTESAAVDVISPSDCAAVAAQAAGVDFAPQDDICFTRAASDLHFCEFEQAPDEPFYYRQKPLRLPIWGCAYQAATKLALRISDAIVVAHGPRSCNFMCRSGLSSQAAKALKRRGIFHPDLMNPNLIGTEMNTTDMIYGGTQTLTQALCAALAMQPPVVFVTTACPPAIIGDDLPAAIRAAQPLSPATRIIPLRTDGNMTGGGMNGLLSAIFDGLLRVAQEAPEGPVDPCSVNIVGDWDPKQSKHIQEMLAEIGVRVNLAYSVNDRNSSVAELRRLSRAPLTIMGSTSFMLTATAKYLQEEFANKMVSLPFPRGFQETCIWLREIGAHLNLQDRVEAYIERHRVAYHALLQRARRTLAGKRIVIFNWSQPIDWVYDTLLDCEMEVVFWGISALRENIPFVSRHWERFPVEFSFHPGRYAEILQQYNPDAVLAATTSDAGRTHLLLDQVGVGESSVGFEPGLHLVRRWMRLFQAPLRGRWREDFVAKDKRQDAPRRHTMELWVSNMMRKN